MLPPGQPTLLVGAMHAGEIDTVLDQSVNDLTAFLYRRMRDYCIGMIPSRW